MLKEFFLKQMLKSKIGSLPKDKQEQVLAVLEKEPNFFMDIAKEIETEMKAGKSQMQAAMEVMRRHEGRLKELFT